MRAQKQKKFCKKIDCNSQNDEADLVVVPGEEDFGELASAQLDAHVDSDGV